MEPTGPKVSSRYLTGPTGSCHDYCKCEIKHTTETKSTNPSPKRVPKPPADRTHIDALNLVPKTNRSPSVIPKITTHNLKNNNVVKDQTLKKDMVIEPKKQDFKLKSVNSQAKTYNRPSSRTPRRRLSDNFVPNKDMSLPSSKLPKRRLSEIIIHPKTDIASVSNGPTVRGSGINKIESRKDSKLPLVNKKCNSVKAIVSTSKSNAKVSPLRTYRSIPKPEVKGQRKSKSVKPIEELEHEETLHVIEPKKVEINKSQSQNRKSLYCSPSRHEVKVKKDGQNEEVESLQLSEKNDTLAKDGQLSSFEVKAKKDDQNVVVESLSRSKEDDISTKYDQNEVVESSSPPMEDDNLAKDVQPSNSEVKAMKDDDQNGVVESAPPSIEDNTLAKDGQQTDNISDSEVNDSKETTQVRNFVVETDQRFRRGTILSPESDKNSLIELQFKKGKELEKETENGENVSLRRLSSDAQVCIPETVTISVDLKHQEMEEKKAAVSNNNVIKEAAGKLIQTRKSKVKALVGAFETIVSNESPKSYTSRSTKLL
ncbi:hypothetical protein R6Q59_029036 [Mikania micrantha]|uniref:Calmodulin-binding domain-containing protein n=1 Tax=Mikania micrantha TaxID=192012 RepID=A0A5N6LWQ8_9ASTR|nr:hypothetical protein E3N88_39354 [Mikania micrantha]